MSLIQRLATCPTRGSSLIASDPPPWRANNSAVELGRFIEQTESVTQPGRLFELLCGFAQNFDCPWIAFGALTHHGELSEPDASFPAVLLNYPQDWRERYFKNGYERVDPVVTKSRQQIGVFRWNDIYGKDNTSKEGRLVFDEAASFGLRVGASMPLHGPGGSFAVVSFAWPRVQEFKTTSLLYLQLAALHFRAVYLKLAQTSNAARRVAPLSARESECLLWAAKGKSSWDTGRILGISENTVNFHIKNAMRKLDSGSRTVAAVKALRLGLIDA